jgi:hypothetical protein
MLSIKKSLAYAAMISVAAGGFVVAGAPAASAATGPPQPYEEPSEGIAVPIFGLIAVAGIATIAIWQGVKDSQKKKQAQREKEEELAEQEKFEEYFDFGPDEPGAAEAANPDSTAAPAESATGAADGE